MAQYGYMNRGYTAQGNGRPATRILPWNSSYNEAEARSDQWNKTGFVTNYEEHREHRCNPEIVACTPDDNSQFIVTRIETTVEHVHTPSVTRYKDSSPTRVAPLVTRYKDSSPPRVAPFVTRYKDSSPTRVAPLVIRYQGSSPTGTVPLVTRYIDNSPTTVAPLVTRYQDSSPTGTLPPLVTRYQDSSPTTVAPLVTRYNKDSSPPRVAPTKGYETINKEWSKQPVNPSHERPPAVDELISKVQTEASRPTRMGPLNGTYWRRTLNPPGGINYETVVPNSIQEPTMVTTDGWTRPSRVGWATLPSHDTALTKPTNDIGTAVEFIQEAIKPPSEKTFTTGRRVNFVTPAIDAKEAARRYNGMMLKADT